MKQDKEVHTIVHKATNRHYDTNEETFLPDSWECTKDTKKYLQMIINNNPDKFEGCEIITNN